MRYITHYEEYPIYEPAEGGYYYSGNQVVDSKKMSKRACKKNLLEIWEESKKDNIERGFREDNTEEWNQIINRTHEYPWYFNKERNYIYKRSYYIGEEIIYKRNYIRTKNGNLIYNLKIVIYQHIQLQADI